MNTLLVLFCFTSIVFWHVIWMHLLVSRVYEKYITMYIHVSASSLRLGKHKKYRWSLVTSCGIQLKKLSVLHRICGVQFPRGVPFIKWGLNTRHNNDENSREMSTVVRQ